MTKINTVSVRIHINLDAIADMLYSANQGTAYWRDVHNAVDSLNILDYEKDMAAFMAGKQRVFIVDAETDSKQNLHTLDLARLKRGLTAMAKNERDAFSDILNDNADMNTADVLIQCALFGKAIYG